MVDILALALSHGLLLLAAWRLLARPDLDAEGAAAKPRARRSAAATMRINRENDGESEGAGDA